MNILPKIALGAWAWGNDGTFGGDLTADALRPIFEAGMANGLNLWDTAYAYGMGTSEKVLAGFLKSLPRESYLVSDKFTPQCASNSPSAMADMIEMQLKLMELDRFDIYWIHNVWGAPHWTEEAAKYFEGRQDAPMIGVSNHNLAEIKQADEILKAHGLRLSAVQNHYSLINRSSEDSGILDYCKENGKEDLSHINTALKRKPEAVDGLADKAKGHIHDFFGCGPNLGQNKNPYSNESDFSNPNSSSKDLMVEARGVEPLSENPRTQASPSAVCVLTFPLARPRRQGHAFSSFIKSRRSQSLERLVPCLNDAGDPRRRKPGADVRGLGRESYVIVVVSSFKFPLLRRSRAAARFSNPPDPRRNQIRPLDDVELTVVHS